MRKNKYLVKWTEFHEVIVEADNTGEAYQIAYDYPSEVTRQTVNSDSIEKIFEHWCSEHGPTNEEGICEGCKDIDSKVDNEKEIL